MFQDKLFTLSIRYIKSNKLRQTNWNEFLHNFFMKKARTKPFKLFIALCSALLDCDGCSFLFLYTYFNNDSTKERDFFVWSTGMSKLLKSPAVSLPEIKNQQGRKFDETCRVLDETCRVRETSLFRKLYYQTMTSGT